ncbi:MAG: hypothetical protein LDL41_11065 [Coleofasciculus sp. S288]|nr:hypothetical protein [Coleofasciculus sp. S288]
MRLYLFRIHLLLTGLKYLRNVGSNLVDAESQIDRTCTPGGAATRSSFVVTGRGGIPLNPLDPLNSDAVVSEWVALDSEEENIDNANPETNPTSVTHRRIVEATGWVKTAEGQMILVAQTPAVTPQTPWLTSPSCERVNAIAQD